MDKADPAGLTVGTVHPQLRADPTTEKGKLTPRIVETFAKAFKMDPNQIPEWRAWELQKRLSPLKTQRS